MSANHTQATTKPSTQAASTSKPTVKKAAATELRRPMPASPPLPASSTEKKRSEKLTTRNFPSGAMIKLKELQRHHNLPEEFILVMAIQELYSKTFENK
jgi:hypothetical protein